MKNKNVILLKKDSIFNFLYKLIFCLTILTLVIFHVTSGVYAKYSSESTGDDNARVADFGNLYFYEYTIDGNRLITGTETEVETVTIVAGENINKNIRLSYSGNEVLVYVFFVVDANGWNFEENSNRFVIKNSGNEDVVYWNLDENWNYISEVSSTTKHVFYHEVEPTIEFDNNILREFEVNPISIDDVNLIKNSNYSLSFSAYAVSALDISPADAWNKVKK